MIICVRFLKIFVPLLKTISIMKRLSAILFTIHCSLFTSLAQPAANYYQAADGKKGAELKTALFQIVSPHEVQTYTPGVWDAINSYDIREDGKIWEIYSGISNFTPKTDQDKGEEIDEEGVVYNREHVFPKSWFNETTNVDNYSTNVYPMYTDLHHLFPTDRFANSLRSNYPYGEVGDKITKQSQGGFSKFGRCTDELGYKNGGLNGRVFEPNDEYKGDLARVYFYMATAYESYKNEKGQERSPKNWKSDMLTSDVYPFFTEWALKMLLRWAQQDPISEKEIKRNEAIYQIQKNRNPFVDYPGLEQYIWGSSMDVAFSYNNYTEPQTTGISHLHRMVTHDDAVYSISGQRVDATSLKKGVYIRGGKKFIVK